MRSLPRNTNPCKAGLRTWERGTEEPTAVTPGARSFPDDGSWALGLPSVQDLLFLARRPDQPAPPRAAAPGPDAVVRLRARALCQRSADRRPGAGGALLAASLEGPVTVVRAAGEGQRRTVAATAGLMRTGSIPGAPAAVPVGFCGMVTDPVRGLPECRRWRTAGMSCGGAALTIIGFEVVTHSCRQRAVPVLGLGVRGPVACVGAIAMHSPEGWGQQPGEGG